jgi:hypothetical protein
MKFQELYQLIVKLAIVIMFMFYGVSYLMGVSELSQTELMNRVFKIGMIYLFTGETGWEWFKIIVVQLFRDGIDFLMFFGKIFGRKIILIKFLNIF